jgi:hypothetical protein
LESLWKNHSLVRNPFRCRKLNNNLEYPLLGNLLIFSINWFKTWFRSIGGTLEPRMTTLSPYFRSTEITAALTLNFRKHQLTCRSPDSCEGRKRRNSCRSRTVLST